MRLSTLKPFFFKLFAPLRSNKSITKINAETFPFEIWMSLAAASAVPPVAIRSSIIKTFSFLLIESLCIWIVAVPYSNSKSTEWTSAGSLFFFSQHNKRFF